MLSSYGGAHAHCHAATRRSATIRDAGPLDPPTSPPVVFVHGILVDSQMWSAGCLPPRRRGRPFACSRPSARRTHAPGRRHRRPVPTRRRPPSDRLPRAPRPHGRDARRQRHWRCDLPVPARHRRVADRPARADELRLLRPVPAVVAAALHGGDATTGQPSPASLRRCDRRRSAMEGSATARSPATTTRR